MTFRIIAPVALLLSAMIGTASAFDREKCANEIVLSFKKQMDEDAQVAKRAIEESGMTPDDCVLPDCPMPKPRRPLDLGSLDQPRPKQPPFWEHPDMPSCRAASKEEFIQKMKRSQ